MTIDKKMLEDAGWKMSTNSSASSYGIPVLLDPNGEPVGEHDFVGLNDDGTLADNAFDGFLVSGFQITGAMM